MLQWSRGRIGLDHGLQIYTNEVLPSCFWSGAPAACGNCWNMMPRIIVAFSRCDQLLLFMTLGNQDKHFDQHDGSLKQEKQYEKGT